MKTKQLILLALVFIFNMNLSNAQDILPFGTGVEPFKGNLYHMYNVGIGTSNPLKQLHIKNGSGSSIIRFENAVGKFWDIRHSGKLMFRSNTQSSLATYMTLTGDGFLGLGTENPEQILHINAENTTTIRLEMNKEELVPSIWDFENSGTLKLKYSNGSISNTYMAIKPTGFLGLGTEDPTAPIHISNNVIEDYTAVRMMETQGDPYKKSRSVKDYYWDIENDGNQLRFNFANPATGSIPYPENKVSISSNGNIIANKFIGDGSGLTGIGGLWEANGNNIYYNAGNVGIGTDSPENLLSLQKSFYEGDVINDENNLIKLKTEFFGDDGYLSEKHTPVIKTQFNFNDTYSTTWHLKHSLFQGFVFTYEKNGEDEKDILSLSEYGSHLNTEFIIKTPVDEDHAIRVYNNDNEENFRVTPTGKVWAREVEVTLGSFADYVFADDYNLRSINELEDYIEENKHLPNVPSEAEVLENGHDLGQMDVILLEKVEELTLYIIEMNKEIKDLKDENKELKSEIIELKSN